MSAAAPELTCQELVELITDYLEDALPVSERARFEVHIRTCDGCDVYLAQMRTTIRLIGTLAENQVDPAARERLLLLFRDWHRG